MCMLCVEYEKGKMTSKEVLNNVGELLRNNENKEEVEHFFELANKVIDKEIPFEEWENDEYTGILNELDRAFESED